MWTQQTPISVVICTTAMGITFYVATIFVSVLLISESRISPGGSYLRKISFLCSELQPNQPIVCRTLAAGDINEPGRCQSCCWNGPACAMASRHASAMYARLRDFRRMSIYISLTIRLSTKEVRMGDRDGRRFEGDFKACRRQII